MAVRNVVNGSIVMMLAKRNNYAKHDICRLLATTDITFEKKLKRPKRFTLEDIFILSGLFNIRIEVLTYLLIHFKCVKDSEEIQRGKEGVNTWYMDNVYKEVEEVKKDLGL